MPAGVLGNTAQESWWALCAALFSSCTVHHKKIPRPNGPGIVVEHSPQHSNLYAGISLLRSVRFKPRNGGTSARFNPPLMSLFELILMQGNSFYEEPVFFGSAWIIHMEAFTNNVKLVKPFNRIA